MPVPEALTADTIGPVLAAAGALGTACFGIVEALKWTPIGEAGFRQIAKYLGSDLSGALRNAYGEGYQQLLRAQYRQDSATQTLIAKTLRQGVRIGLTPANAGAIAGFLGSVDAQALKKAVANVAQGAEEMSSDDRGVIGRFELAVDARIDSALSSAQDVYLGTVRCAASLLAIAIAEIAAWQFSGSTAYLGRGLVIGLIAVPIAPIANDVVAALQAATKALRGR